ncbi:MAG TPA: GDSL-type esterase/lipase family protein [Ktedonobacterales bacterium]|nr:GDSL-type esterase/lipase family protein [Ktedonobacterales bacterium]
MLSLLGALALGVALLAGCGVVGPATSGTTSETPVSTARPSVVYVALGASDAVGVGASDPAHTAYVPIIISRLPKNSFALNLGISGETLHNALRDELPQAIQAQPTLMTIWLMGNDFKDCVPLNQYGADLNTLLTQLQTKTHAKIFVANAPDMSQLPAIKQQAAEQGSFCGVPDTPVALRGLVIQWNNVIDASVTQHGDVLVDLFDTPLTAHPDYIYSDGFHPSDKGYLALANLFWAAIVAHGGVPKTQAGG